MKLFNKTIDRQLFNQYALGSDLSKQEVVAKIFNPVANGTWYILNSDPQDPDYLWAIVDLGYGAEVGSVSRSELENYRGRFGLGFERDLSFDPVNALELYNGLRQGKYYADGGLITEEKLKEEEWFSPDMKIMYQYRNGRLGITLFYGKNRRYSKKTVINNASELSIKELNLEVKREIAELKQFAKEMLENNFADGGGLESFGEKIKDDKGLFYWKSKEDGKIRITSGNGTVYFLEFDTLPEAEAYVKKVNAQTPNFFSSTYAKGGNIENLSDNQRMIMNQNVELEHHHEELEDILKDEIPVPAWVVAKMETATQNLSDVTHYLEGQKEIMEDQLEEQDDDDDDVDDEDEIENKEVVEPINVSAGTKSEITKKFTDNAWGNLRGFLKGMEGIDLRDDYTFDYKSEQYEIEPIINSDENGVLNAVFSIFDGDGEEVGEVAYSRDGGKQKFTANSEFFSWNNAKFEDGGFMNGVYADGGYFDGTIPKVSTYMSNYADGGNTEIDNLNKNTETREKMISYIVNMKSTSRMSDRQYDALEKRISEKSFAQLKKEYDALKENSSYDKGGEIAKAEILGFSRNIMGTTDIEMKITGMRKPQDFIVYPIGKDDAGNVITIQSDTRIGQINLVKGVGVMSQSHQGGAYFVHLQMDKLTSFELSEKDLKDLKAFINKTSGANVGSSMIKSDNSGASRIFAKGGQIPEWLFIGVYPNAYIFADKRIDNSGNYYEIGRIVFNPFQIRIFDNSSKYASAIEIINKEAKELEKQGYVEISATGQTVEIKKMSNGGETEEGVDLFEEYDNIPPKLQKILDKHQEAFEDGDYRGLEKALKEVNAIGYTFEYYLDGQAYDLRKIGEKGKSEVEEYAKGGTLKKYILKADIKTVTVKRNGKEVTYKGDDVLNGANVLAKGGNITSKANYIPKRDVVEVELKDGSKVKPVNGYWVKKGAEPIGAELKPTSSVKSEPKINTTEIRKDARGNWRAETNIDNFNGYDWRLSTVKTYSGNLVSSAQGGKSEPSGTKGYSLFKYTVYEDPNHTLEVSKPKRLTDKVVSEQHDKALAKFKKFMETGMFKGGGKISNFDKLSAKVAKQYEGKPVKSQYQEEYGKYYSKEEAKEVGDKVAGKMKAMTTDKKAFGGFFGSALKSTSKKYPNLDDMIVTTKDGKSVFVISQTSDSLLVIDANKIGTGVAPHRINISEIDPTSFKAGGKIRGKRVNGGTEMLKKANDLAKKIRKDGESWIDAKKRAFAQLKN